MIKGIGTDMVEISRIEKIIREKPRFLSRNFTKNEIKYFESKKNPYESIAGNFAGKEAVSKALGTGFKGFDLIDIEITRNKAGAPIVSLYGGAKDLKDQKNIKEILVSLSHCKDYALAYCLAQ